MTDGSVTVGPNSALGWARESYKKYSVDSRDLADFLSFLGFWRLIWNNRVHAVTELKSSIKKRLLEGVRKILSFTEDRRSTSLSGWDTCTSGFLGRGCHS